MPAYSGLWDGTHGEAYADMPKSDALPPAQRGIVRALMQGRGMHGHVTALGRNSPSAIAQIPGGIPDRSVPGTFNYDTRTTDRDVNVPNLGRVTVGSGLDQEFVSQARPTNATETDMAHTYDTTLRNGHPADSAGSGSTSPAVAEAISDGT